MAPQNKRKTLHDALQGMNFPATNRDVIEHATGRGVEEIQWGNQTLNLRQALVMFTNTTFLSDVDVENAIAANESDTGISSGPAI